MASPSIAEHSAPRAPIPTQLPGLVLQTNWPSRVRFSGTRAAIAETHLVPSNQVWPGDEPKMRGSKWIGADGRIWKLTKCQRPVGHFDLTIWRTRSEEDAVFRARSQQERHASNIRGQISALEGELKRTPRSAASEHEMVCRCTDGLLNAIVNICKALDEEAREELIEGCAQIYGVVENANLTWDPRQVRELEKKLADLRAIEASGSAFARFLSATTTRYDQSEVTT